MGMQQEAIINEKVNESDIGSSSNNNVNNSNNSSSTTSKSSFNWSTNSH